VGILHEGLIMFNCRRHKFDIKEFWCNSLLLYCWQWCATHQHTDCTVAFP